MSTAAQYVIRLPGTLSGVQVSGEAAKISTKRVVTEPPPVPPTAVVIDEPSAAEVAAERIAAMEELLLSLQEAVTELEQRRAQSLHELQEVAIELAVAVATHVTCQIIQRGEHQLEKMVQALLQKIPLETSSILCVHPADVQLLEENEQSQGWLRSDSLHIRADPRLPRGDVRLETASGRVQVSEIATCLERIRQRWLEELQDAQIERRQAAGMDRGLQRYPDRRGTA